MSQSGRNPVIKSINVLQAAFDYIAGSPLLIGLLAGMTVFVLHVPVAFLFYGGLFENVPHASLFFEGLPIANNILLAAHIAGAIPAIVFGPFMFIEAIRRDHIKVHRFMGKIYVFGCMLSAVTVFPLALANPVGLVPHIGFGFMAVIWFLTTFFAYTAIMNKDIVTHRRWMMRSYAMTFAFVHVNLTYKILVYPYIFADVPPEIFTMMNNRGIEDMEYLQGVAGIENIEEAIAGIEKSIKALQSMVSWLANLMLVEIYLAATTHTGRFAGFKKFARHCVTWSRFDKFHFRPFSSHAASTKAP